MANRLWVLGANDPEMVTIEGLLSSAGEEVVYLLSPNGQRVHPGNAYAGDYLSGMIGPRRGVVWVECYPRMGSELELNVRDMSQDGWDFTVIDHHRPGDPGYGRGSGDYLVASSLGQVISWLIDRDGGDCASGMVCDMERESIPLTSPVGRAGKIQLCTRFEDGLVWEAFFHDGQFRQRIRKDLLLTAAADHCLEAAYRGRCPGVDPDELMKWRAASRAAFQKRSVEGVLADVEEARELLQEAIQFAQVKSDQFGNIIVPEYADFRGVEVPELPEAACREGIAYISEVSDRDGRRKVVLGAAGPELVRRFMAGELVPGLTGIYGDPERGFAGGYLPG